MDGGLTRNGNAVSDRNVASPARAAVNEHHTRRVADKEAALVEGVDGSGGLVGLADLACLDLCDSALDNLGLGIGINTGTGSCGGVKIKHHKI